MHCNNYAKRVQNASDYSDTIDNAEIIGEIDLVDLIQSIRFDQDPDDGLEQQLVRADHLHRIANDT